MTAACEKAVGAMMVRTVRAKAYQKRLKAQRPRPVALVEVTAPTARQDGEVVRIADGLAIELADVELVHVDREGREVKETATARRVQAPIERMVSRGQLSQEQARIGRKLHAAYALGVCGARDGNTVGSGRKEFGLGDAQLCALLDYRKVMLWLTPEQRGVLMRVVCWDVPVKLVAVRTRTPAGTIMELLRSGLDRASDYFD